MNGNTLKILYEDNHLIVVIKDPGVLSQADNTNDLDILTLIKGYLKDETGLKRMENAEEYILSNWIAARTRLLRRWLAVYTT